MGRQIGVRNAEQRVVERQTDDRLLALIDRKRCRTVLDAPEPERAGRNPVVEQVRIRETAALPQVRANRIVAIDNARRQTWTNGTSNRQWAANRRTQWARRHQRWRVAAA